MLSTVAGSVIEANCEQPAKDASPMAFKPAGNVTLVTGRSAKLPTGKTSAAKSQRQ